MDIGENRIGTALKMLPKGLDSFLDPVFLLEERAQAVMHFHTIGRIIMIQVILKSIDCVIIVFRLLKQKSHPVICDREVLLVSCSLILAEVIESDFIFFDPG